MEIGNKATIDQLVFSAEGTDLLIEGRVQGTPDIAAVIAYVDPDGRSSYDALSAVSVLDGDAFWLRSPIAKPGGQNLYFGVCHYNGAVTEISFGPFLADKNRVPDVDSLQARALCLPAVMALRKGDNKEAASLAKEAMKSKEAGRGYANNCRPSQISPRTRSPTS